MYVLFVVVIVIVICGTFFTLFITLGYFYVVKCGQLSSVVCQCHASSMETFFSLFTTVTSSSPWMLWLLMQLGQTYFFFVLLPALWSRHHGCSTSLSSANIIPVRQCSSGRTLPFRCLDRWYRFTPLQLRLGYNFPSVLSSGTTSSCLTNDLQTRQKILRNHFLMTSLGRTCESG